MQKLRTIRTGQRRQRFEYSGSKWQYNLATKNYTAPGTYTIQMVSRDQCQYQINSCIAQFVIK